MKHLYFIRHGESVMNVQGIASGISDTPLTPLGKVQAQKAGKEARDKGLVFDIILCSPLERAHHTALAIAEHTGYPIDKIQLLDSISERNFGHMEGKTLEDFGVNGEIYTNDPFAIDHVPEVETILEIQARANKVLEYINSLHHDTVLIVSHGAFGRAFQRSVKNLPITEFGERLDNATIVKLI